MFLVISLRFLDHMMPAIMSVQEARIPEPSMEIVAIFVLRQDADNTGTSAGSDLKGLSCHRQWAPLREPKMETKPNVGETLRHWKREKNRRSHVRPAKLACCPFQMTPLLMHTSF